MRIGIDARPLQSSARNAGIGRYLLRLVTGLAARDGANDYLLFVGEGGDREVDGAPRWPRVGVPRRSALGRFAWLDERMRLSGTLRREEVDLFHAHGLAEMAATIPRPTRRTRVVVTVHDIIPWLFRAEHPAFWPRGRGHYDYRRRLHDAARADAIVTVSQHSKRDLVEHLGIPEARIFVTPEAADPHFRPVRDAATLDRVRGQYALPSRYFLYVGGFYSPRKRVDRLIDAYKAYLGRGDPAVGLVLTGGRLARRRHPLWQQLADTELAQHVHLTERVDDADLPALYSGATALVYPSLYEGFGLPPLEAMACGTPVVTSAHASLPEVTGDAARIVDPLDDEALAGELVRLAADAELRADLSRRGLARSAQFSWERMVDQTLRVYEQVLGA